VGDLKLALQAQRADERTVKDWLATGGRARRTFA
jgi:hypothetical protein